MNELQAIESTLPANPADLIFNDASFARMERVAEIMASGRSTIPAHLRGSVGDCFAILLQAARWRMDPYAVAQKTHIVNGVMGYEAQLVSAVINSSKVVIDRFHFEWFGDWTKVVGKFKIKQGDKGEYRVPGWSLADEEGLGVRVWATLKGEDEPRELTLLLAQARTRNSTLWADDPRQQLAYLAQKRWARLYAPDVILGVYSEDELAAPREIDMGPADVVEQKPATASQSVKDRVRASKGTGNAAAQSDEQEKALQSVIDRIKSASNAEELKAAREEAAKLPEPFKSRAASVYNKTVADLRKAGEQATVVDQETGEITQDDGGPIPGLD
jgi:hypothetical protein